MRIRAAMAMAIMIAGAASGRNIEINRGPVAVACVEYPGSLIQMRFAETLASRMFSGIGVTIRWEEWNRCPADGIRITMVQSKPESDHPGAYAYAFPFEGQPGAHIVLFQDRIARGAEPRALPFLLGHILAHEITHVLQGTCRHSESGVMKATFRRLDISQMEVHSLPFTDEDVELIRSGHRARELRLSKSGEVPAEGGPAGLPF